MYLMYVKQCPEAEKTGMIEVGQFYKVLSCTTTTLFILDDADEQLEVPMLNMGIVPSGSHVRLTNDIEPGYSKGHTGIIQSNIDALAARENSSDSISYFFTPDNDNDIVLLCDREDFELV